MAVGQHQHTDAKRDLLGAARQEGQAGERVQERPVRRDDELVVLTVGVRGMNLPGRNHAISRPDRVEALSFSTTRGLHERVWASSPARDGKKDTKLHLFISLPQ